MGRMLFSYVSNFILDDVYGTYALLVCIQFLYFDDVYGAYALLVCIEFLYWTMCMGRMLFSYVSNFYTR